ncbi:hypothetical protein FRC10_006979 [Ceratobasidium sp. 414]|nr:hypothetical protein FRC10_006979 [Ceratobasidium sp. 414]
MSNSGARNIAGAGSTPHGKAAPTPVNTPLNTAPISQGFSRPTVPDTIEEDKSDDEDMEEVQPDQAAQAIFNLVQGRLAGLVGRSSGYIENLPPKTKRRIEGLKGVQTKYASLEAQMKREMLELEKKYLALYTPLFERRHAILSGESEPTDEEVTTGEAVTAKDKEDEDEEEKELAASLAKLATIKDKKSDTKESEEDDSKGISQFWLTALRNHPQLQTSITERDEEALSYLSDVRLSYLPDPDLGFKLTFVFDENPYFENEELDKAYFYQKELSYSGEYMYQRAKGTKIKWKEDKDLTKTIEIKKQRNKNTNRTRLIRRTQTIPSFFDFFSPPLPMSSDPDLVASGEAVDGDELTEEQLEQLEEKLEIDYQVGEDLKEKIASSLPFYTSIPPHTLLLYPATFLTTRGLQVIPRAVDYFTGKALQFDHDVSDFEDEESDPSEGDSDEDSDDDPPARRAPTGPKKKGEAEKAEECKNQ